MSYRKSGETRSRILKAAARIFAERGYYETSIADIAAEAGIGRPSFYYYFDDKEKTARALFDSYVDRIYAAADAAVPTRAPVDARGVSSEAASPDSSFDAAGRVMLNVFVKYILLFKYVALNKATHAVYYDLVNFADYDRANIERLKRTTFKETQGLATFYGKELSDAELVAFIVTTNAVAKSIFKAVSNGILDFSLQEATDYFYRHAILPDISMSETAYLALKAEAFAICERTRLD